MEGSYQPETDFKELGKKGGDATLHRYGKEHFKRIGKKGRTRISEEAKHQRGLKGGQATFAKHGREHMVEMSRKARLAKEKKAREKDPDWAELARRSTPILWNDPLPEKTEERGVQDGPGKAARGVQARADRVDSSEEDQPSRSEAAQD